MKKYVKCQIVTSICRKIVRQGCYQLPCWREGRDINNRGPERTRNKIGKAALFYPTQALYKQVNKATLVPSVLTYTIIDVNYWIATQWPPLRYLFFLFLFPERIKTQKMGTFSGPGEWKSKRPSQSEDRRERQTDRQTEQAEEEQERQERGLRWTGSFKGCTCVAQLPWGGNWQQAMT